MSRRAGVAPTIGGEDAAAPWLEMTWLKQI